SLFEALHSNKETLVSKDEKKLRKQVLNELTLKMQLISHSKEEPSPKGDNETEVKEKLQNKKRVVFLILGFLQKLNLLKARGIIYLFDIQSKIFNYVYDGNAVIAQAHTGTGKTFSFAIPLIEKLQSDALERKMGRPPKVLVLTLTRELAKKIQRYNQKTGNSMLYGGTAYNPQIDAIRNGIDILEGTPGYIKDHLRNNKLNLSKLKHVVLDEADHMLDVSFAEQVEEILVSAYKKGSEDNPQTLLFSATCPNWVYDVAKKYMRTKFEQVELIGKKTKKTTTIAEHLAIGYKEGSKELAINSSIKQETQSLHGDIPQKQRKIILKGFRNVIQCAPPRRTTEEKLLPTVVSTLAFGTFVFHLQNPSNISMVIFHHSLLNPHFVKQWDLKKL
uniref:DEAD (Asp-Glu-Ala-Asp) box helicase 21 n=1 Tax=Erpetoichthys calabaricus TaxID=27687 RepID=A0A8C4T7M0_ERPCA